MSQVVECVSLTELHRYVDPDVLPPQLGGTSPVVVGEAGTSSLCSRSITFALPFIFQTFCPHSFPLFLFTFPRIPQRAKRTLRLLWRGSMARRPSFRQNGRIQACRLFMSAGIDTFVRPLLFVGRKGGKRARHLFMSAGAHASRATPCFCVDMFVCPFCFVEHCLNLYIAS
jgi:hypothetical protein